MPTYINNTAVTQKFIVKGKNLFIVKPGVIITSQSFTTNANLTLVSETPYYNRLSAVDKIANLSATPSYVTINPDTNTIVVVQITGEVTVYSQDILNTPPVFLAWTSENPVIPIDADGSFNKLVCTGSGACTVYQYK